MAKAGKRKPRKQISSKMGAAKVPKRVMTQAVAGVAKNVVDREVFGRGDEGGDDGHHDAESEAERDEAARLPARGGPMPVDAVEKPAMPEEREHEPGREQSDDIDCGHHADLQHGVRHGDDCRHADGGEFSPERKDDFEDDSRKPAKTTKRSAWPRLGTRRGVGTRRRRGGKRFRRERSSGLRLGFGEVHGRKAHGFLDRLAAFLAGFVAGFVAEAVGTPVFFSGTMNLPRAVRGRSGAAVMSSGWGPALGCGR